MKTLVLVVALAIITSSPGFAVPGPPPRTGILIVSANPTRFEFVAENAESVEIDEITYFAYKSNAYPPYYSEYKHHLFKQNYQIHNTGEEVLYIFQDRAYDLGTILHIFAREHGMDSHPSLFYYGRGIVNQHDMEFNDTLFEDFLDQQRGHYCPDVADISQLNTCEGIIVIQPGETKSPFQ